MGAPLRPAIWCSVRSAFTVQGRSSGSPEAGPILPPTRSVRRAPSPASKAVRTATGSHIGPMAAPVMPRSSMRRRMKVESPGAPLPGLSARSASTTGAPSKASAASSASSMDR